MEGIEFLSAALNGLSESELVALVKANDAIRYEITEMIVEEYGEEAEDNPDDFFEEFIANDNITQYVIEGFEIGFGEMGLFDDVKSVEEARELLLKLS